MMHWAVHAVELRGFLFNMQIRMDCVPEQDDSDLKCLKVVRPRLRAETNSQQYP